MVSIIVGGMTAGTGGSCSHCFTIRKQKMNKKWGQAKKTLRPIFSDLLPSLRLHLLNVPSPSKTELPAWDQVFRYLSLWGTLHTETTVEVGLLRLANFMKVAMEITTR